MAMPRPMMVLRDRRDRLMLPQQQGHGRPPGPPGPPLLGHGHFNLPPNRFEGEEKDMGRMLPTPPVGWEVHQHQHQQALSGAIFGRRLNLQQQHHPPPPLLHGQPCPGPPQEWDGPHLSAHEVLRMRQQQQQQQPMGLGGRDLDGEFIAGLRHREEMGDIRNVEHLKLASRVSHEKLIESEYLRNASLRNASRASHEKRIEREYLKNAYRASHEKLIEKEYLKKVSRVPHGNLIENDRALGDMSRPFHRPSQTMEPPTRNHGGAFGWEENPRSDLVMRFGARQQHHARSQDLPADVSIPPGFQSVIMSCKRPREEDTDFERARLQRPRRPPLGPDNPPPGIHTRPLMRVKEEQHEESKVLQGNPHRGVGVRGDDPEEGQLPPPPPLPVPPPPPNPPPSVVPHFRVEPIGPPGFYKPELEASRSGVSHEVVTIVSKRGTVPELHHVNGNPIPSFPSHPDTAALSKPKPGTSRPATARLLPMDFAIVTRSLLPSRPPLGNDSGTTTRPSTNRGAATDSGPSSRPSTSRAIGIDSGSNSARPSSARAIGIDSGSSSRPSIARDLEIDSIPLSRPSTSRPTGIDSSGTTRSSGGRVVGIDATSSSRPTTARVLASDSGPTSRPSTARTVAVDSGIGFNQHDRGESSIKGEILVPKRERSSPTPLRKGSEQMPGRQKRSFGVGEANATFISDIRRRIGKVSDSRSRHLDVRSQERDHDGERRKRPHQEDDQQKDSRPHSSSRKARVVADSDERPLKGPRWDNALKLKSARQSTTKEGLHGHATTVSLHKQGERNVKVEDFKLRSSSTRPLSYKHSHHERGGVRDATESKNIDTERPSENRSKDSEELLSLAGQDKGLGPQSSKDVINHRHSFGSISQERDALLPHQVKKEVLPLSDKPEHEPQRPAILSRLTTLKPDTIPTNTRLRTEMVRQEKLVSQANSKILLPCGSSKKSSHSPIQILGDKIKRDNVVEGTERPASKQVASNVAVEDKMLTPTSLRVLSGKSAGRVQATREELNLQLNARLLKLQIPDGLKGDEEGGHTRYPSISISPNGIKNVIPPLQKGLEGLQRDPRIPESRNTDKADALQLRLEGPTVDLLASSSELCAGEVTEQSPGRPTPKLIYTGHKSEQSLKESSPQADNSFKELSGLSVPRSSDLKIALDRSESRKASVSVIANSSDSARRVEPIHTRQSYRAFQSASINSDAGPNSPQRTSAENKTRSIARHPENLLKISTSSIPTSLCLSSSLPSLKSLRKQAELIDFSHALPLSNDVSGVEKEPEVPYDLGANQFQVQQEEKAVLAPSPLSLLAAPKEVRLFGANLIAPVMERIDSSSRAFVSVTPVEPEVVSVSAEVVQPSPLPQQIMDSSTSPEEAVNVPTETVEQAKIPIETQEVKVEEVKVPIETEQAVAVDHSAESIEQPLLDEDQQSAEPIVPDVTDLQISSNVSQSQGSLAEEKQVVTIPLVQKGASGSIARPPTSSRPAGAHTWVRRSAPSGTPPNTVLGFRNPSAGTSGVPQPAGRGRGTQGAGYVRKGNSLVRAPGAVALPPPAPPVSMLGQTRSMVSQGPGSKPPTFRNPSMSNHDTPKSFLSGLRKYSGTSTENVGVILPVSRPVSVSSGSSQTNNVSLVEPFISSSRPKTPPQGALGVSSTSKTGPVASVSTLPPSGAGSKLQGPCDDVGDILAEATNTSPGSNTALSGLPSNPAGTANTSLGLNNMVYVRRKANQLVVASCPQSVELSLAEKQAAKKQLTPGLYIKRKTNQLVRNNVIRGSGNGSFVQALLGNGPPQNPTEEGRRNSILYKKMRRGRVLRQKKVPTGRSSLVWTLNGATVSHEPDTTGQVPKPAPLLFPWKRHSLTTSVRSRRVRTLPEGKKGSLLFVMSERLRRVRPVQPVYTRSADGFSLHRSGVLCVGGGNLKWTKLLDERAKLASEVATKAVAAAESRKREKKEAVVEAVVKAKSDRRVVRKAAKGGERIVWVGLVRYKMDASSKTLQRIPDTKGETGAAVSSGPASNPPLLTPRRSYIGGTTYLRVGNGNQLVRDPKAASHALASEKVRWSLHHARSRGVKKQQYCQFFTRFGKCNKENGKCIYIHDPDKVAVCTKFLKGNCTDDHCLLTHKVIPERMPDCSFFLEGLCTNESCPYRHVNVNPKAPYCDGFLRGYCKDGDKCNKKHTYVCPTHAATGECADQSTCKLHHPKKKDKPESGNVRKVGIKRKRRYFCPTEQEPTRKESSAADEAGEDERFPEEDLAEFISLANTEDQDGDTKVSPENQKPWSYTRPGVPSFIMKEATAESGSAQEVERWIKPTFLFKVTSPAAS